MTKVKSITLLLITLALMLIIPHVANAATEYTYSDTVQSIEWGYEIDDGGNIVNLRCKSTAASGQVTIPATIDEKKVTSLKQDAFKEIIGITKVIIPEGVTSIGRSAFYGCISLSEVTIPKTVVKIENYAFEDCTSLSKVVLPDNLVEIPEKLFESCKNLSQVTFPANLVTIGNYAFDGCNALATITLPEKLVTIGDGAFRGCSTLQSVVIPNSVTVLAKYSFVNCVSLKDLTLSNKITRLENETFTNCTSITSIKIPESVTTIGTGGYSWYSPFNGCTGLLKVLIPDSVTNIAKDVFYDCAKQVTIFGNEGKTSKKYAEDNKLNFRPISEWDTFDGTSDAVAPTVKSIEIPHASVSGYYDSNSTTYIVPVNKVLIINVNFSETITATTPPTLTIKFGNGKNIELTNGVVSGSTVAYSYTIAKNDVGTMAIVSLTGGNVKDDAGNEATLSCPKLKVTYWDHYVYANGTAIDVEDNKATDTTKPTVNTIAVTSPMAGTYKSGQTVKITVTFSENITGSTVPTLKIRFGTSEERSITKGTISGKTIVYEYTIVDGDKGQLAVTGYAGGTIKDAAGNDATITSKTLSGYTIKANAIDTTEYVSFPFIIFNGEGSVDVNKNKYAGKYTMYYQFVEVSTEVMNKLNTLKEKYKNKEITYEEYFVQKNEIMTKYNDNNWTKTEDGSFKKDLSKFTGTKNFTLWVKLVMDDKTVYESEVYTMNSTGQATNNPDANDNLEEKEETDDTVAQKEYDKAGVGIGIIAGIVIIISAGAVALSKYRKLSDI